MQKIKREKKKNEEKKKKIQIWSLKHFEVRELQADPHYLNLHHLLASCCCELRAHTSPPVCLKFVCRCSDWSQG